MSAAGDDESARRDPSTDREPLRGSAQRFLLVAVDLTVAATVAGTQWVPQIVRIPSTPLSAVATGLMGIMVIGVVLRWRHPIVATCVVALVTLAGLLTGTTNDPMLAAAWAIYPLALQRGLRQGWLRLALFLFVLLIATVSASAERSDLVVTILVAVAALTCSWTLGSAVGDRAALAAESAYRRARLAAVQQRLDVAREVHDVVAHTLGTIGVEASVAAHIDTLTADELREQLADISVTSRRALGQVKGLLTTLRGDEGGGTEAAPTVADLSRVFEHARGAGLSVETSLGGIHGLGDVEQLAVFRIVQEAVTNAIRHGSPGTCVVTSDRVGQWLIVEVVNTGEGEVEALVAGNGLRGIRERAAAAGGSCVIETVDRRGVRVHVELPYFTPESAAVEEKR